MAPQRERLEAGKAVLVLEDGTCFFGRGFGSPRKVTGEVVFSTSMVGYTEALTDPSYKGQILALTYPLVGNYGVPEYGSKVGVPTCFESNSIVPTGLVIHELCWNPFHWASAKTLDQWLKEEGTPGIYGIDTRRLAKKLRERGVMLGILQTCQAGEDPDVSSLLKEAETIPDPNQTDLVKEVTINEPLSYQGEIGKGVVVVDCGMKNGILRNLLGRKLKVIRVPYDYTANQILHYEPNGVIISNGPGDPKKCATTVATVRELLNEKLPIMGICLGNQILALALGGDTYKLKYGHRSQNQPVLNIDTQRAYMSTQNHGYAVHPDSLKGTNARVWFINANDKTVEGIKHDNKPAFAVQWHPEAAPGPYDTEFLFDQFVKLMGD